MPSKNAKLFLERIRLDLFAAEQRLDYDFIGPGMTLAELFDADVSGRAFPSPSFVCPAAWVHRDY